MYPTDGGQSQGNCEVGCDNNWNFGGGGIYGGNVTEVEIINNLTNPCAKSIFEGLRIEMIKKNILQQVMQPTPKVNLTFAESILKLFNDSNTFNLSITNGNLNNSGGSTIGSSITIGDAYLKSATSLSIARTMIHEMVHAYLNTKYANFIDLNDWDFKIAMDKYATDNGFNPNGTAVEKNRFHHEFMGQYVDAMAISLVSWDQKYGTGGITRTDSRGHQTLDWEYYKSMAYGGLYYEDSYGNQIATDSFKALVPNKSDRDIIKNILKNEQDGNGSSKGTKC